jgi:hypothetical protein
MTEAERRRRVAGRRNVNRLLREGNFERLAELYGVDADKLRELST